MCVLWVAEINYVCMYVYIFTSPVDINLHRTRTSRKLTRFIPLTAGSRMLPEMTGEVILSDGEL